MGFTCLFIAQDITQLRKTSVNGTIYHANKYIKCCAMIQSRDKIILLVSSRNVKQR